MRIYRVSKILQHKILEERGILKCKKFMKVIILENLSIMLLSVIRKFKMKQYIIPRSSEHLKKFNVEKLMKRGIGNNRGVALVLTLLITMVLVILGSIFVIRSINEWNAARKEKIFTQVFYVADGGAESGLNMLDTLINTYLLNTINGTSPATVIANVQS